MPTEKKKVTGLHPKKNRKEQNKHFPIELTEIAKCILKSAQRYQKNIYQNKEKPSHNIENFKKTKKTATVVGM